MGIHNLSCRLRLRRIDVKKTVSVGMQYNRYNSPNRYSLTTRFSWMAAAGCTRWPAHEWKHANKLQQQPRNRAVCADGSSRNYRRRWRLLSLYQPGIAGPVCACVLRFRFVGFPTRR